MTSLTFTWLNNRETDKQKDKLANGQTDTLAERHRERRERQADR